MGSGSKKKGEITMGNYAPKDNEREAMHWCIHNNIFISAHAKSTTEWYVTICINGNTNKSPEAYEQVSIWKQIYKYYLYYYNKYNNIPIIVEKVIIKTEPIKRQQKPISADNLKLF
jgi:hypothetical protein